MPTFNYFQNIPNAPNAPSRDQPKMRTITNSIRDIIAIDHFTFQEDNLDGWHRQVTFPTRNIPGAPTNPASIIYTDIGQASPSTELRFINSNANYLISGLRAFGTFLTQNTNGAVPLLNGHNVQSISRGAGAIYTITLFPNVCTGNNISFFNSSTTGGSFSFSISIPTIDLSTGTTVSGTRVAFQILQA